jgi:gas vesicle protein
MGDNNNDIGAFLTGFVIGGLVGAATALLLAPQSGQETRTLIREKSIELKDKAAETAEQAMARAEAAAAEARTYADELRQKGQTIFEEQKHKLEEALASIKKAEKEAVEAVETAAVEPASS